MRDPAETRQDMVLAMKPSNLSVTQEDLLQTPGCCSCCCPCHCKRAWWRQKCMHELGCRHRAGSAIRQPSATLEALIPWHLGTSGHTLLVQA